MSGKLPLEGIRVADFSWILAGPHLTAWLGSMGAEVIRVEWPGHPDVLRMAGVAAGGGVNVSSGFNGLNYSKKSCTIDLNEPKGRELAYKLVSVSDIAVEAYGSLVTERFGLTYEKLREVKPDIIVVANSPFGRSGPQKNAVAWGPNTQAYAGLTALNGYAGEIPAGIGPTWPDYMVGVSMVFPVLAALHHRQKTGEGQYLDVSMGEIVTSMIPEAILDYEMNGRVAEPKGNRSHVMAPHQVYRCQGDDAWVAVTVGSDNEWAALCRTLSHPEWLEDPRFSTLEARRNNEKELDSLITEWTLERTSEDVMNTLQSSGVPAARVSQTMDIIGDPQIAHREFIKEIDHPQTGVRSVAGIPAQWGSIQERYDRAPLLGEDNDYVFQNILGLSKDEIRSYTEAGVVVETREATD